jgi:hypothetical protein
MTRDRQIIWLGGILLLSVLALAFLPPIPQSQAYHNFADQRSLFGIPNFLNVLSNLPFLLAGIAGFYFCARNRISTAPFSWIFFFGAFGLVGLGSAYYHLAPADSTLVLDRLPMALAFMSLFSAILNDSLWPGSERWLLPLLLMLGAASVIWWDYSGDLRLYGWVQFAPLLFIAFLAKFHGFHSIRRASLGAAFIAYILAKVFEALDLQIYDLTGQLLSGHSLKHLTAAASGYILYRMLRTGLNAPADESR